jgi:hypothetical protein
MPMALTVDVGWPWWVITIIACAVVLVSVAVLGLSRNPAARAAGALLALEGIVIAVVAPFVMSDMNSNRSATAAGGTGMQPGRSSSVIHVVEHAAAPHMQMFGAVETFANPIFDSRDMKRVGRDQGFCVHIPITKTPECAWTTILPGGQITAQGPLTDAEVSVVAITGGTGRYENAGGRVESKTHNKAGTKFDLIFHVSG